MTQPHRAAAIYARISRDRAGAGLGVARQRDDCKALAARLGWTVVAVRTDNDVSAFSGRRRPGYEALLSDIEAGRVDAVLAWHPDRLHRSPKELERFISIVEAHHVAVNTVTAGAYDLSTASGRMAARIVGAVARHESEHKSERIRREVAQRAATGVSRATNRPFGYLEGGMQLHPVEAPALAECYRLFVAGATLRSLARSLADAGFVGTRGATLDSKRVRILLRSPRNAGLAALNGEVVGPALWPPVVDEATWRAAVTRLADPARRTSPGSARKHLLSGVATCGVCGQYVRVAGTIRRPDGTVGHGKHLPRYRCATGSHVARAAAAIDEYVTEIVLARLARPDAVDLLATPAPGAPDPAELSGRATGLRARLDDLAEAFAAGEITRRQLAAGTEKLRAELAGVEAQIAAAARVDPLADIATAPDPAAVWEKLDLGRRQAIIKALMTITIGRSARGAGFDAASIRIEWRTA